MNEKKYVLHDIYLSHFNRLTFCNTEFGFALCVNWQMIGGREKNGVA